MRPFARDKSEQNIAWIDPWTLVHLGSGLASGLMGLSAPACLAAAVVYEGVEQVVEQKSLGRELFQTSRPESAGNAVVDVAVFAAGHALGKWWNRTGRVRRREGAEKGRAEGPN